MTVVTNTRRKRKRKVSIIPRFGASSIAFEIALVRMMLNVQGSSEKRQRRIAGAAK